MQSQGTCFLFQCGPPENFRCKFTRHANYSSAVLSPIRQVMAPPPPPPPPTPPPVHTQTVSPQMIGLSQHEMELASLRDVKTYRRDPLMMTTTTTPVPPAHFNVRVAKPTPRGK